MTQSRRKGCVGEREVAAIVRDLTGWNVQGRVRQLDGDCDLEGVPGWSVEVKRRKAAPRGQIGSWWRQTVEQAGELLPVLLYRADRDSWRAVWPVGVLLLDKPDGGWRDIEWTADTTVAAWAAAARTTLLANGGSKGIRGTK